MSRHAKGWDRTPFLIAHRGYSSVAPENTRPAFERALEAGASVLECDVQMSRDGIVVVIHDPEVDRTTDGHGRVSDLQWEQLRRLDAGYPARFGRAFAGQRLMRLEELLELARGSAQVFVEIKPEAIDGDNGLPIEARVLAAARATGMIDDVAVLSFAPRALERVRSLAPRVPCGLVFRWWRRRRLVREATEVGARYLVPYAGRLLERPELVSEAHAAGVRVGTYVVDDPLALRSLLAAGVDGIATNRVGDLLPLIEERQEEGGRAGGGPTMSDRAGSE